jgi:hypothetical protein
MQLRGTTGAERVAVSADGLHVATSQYETRVYEVASGASVKMDGSPYLDALVFARRTLAGIESRGEMKGAIHFWDAHTGARQTLATERRIPSRVGALVDDGRLLLLVRRGDGERGIIAIDTVRRRVLLDGPGAEGDVHPSGALIASVSGPIVQLHDGHDGRLVAELLTRDDATLVLTGENELEVVGDRDAIRPYVSCRVGAIPVPLRACEDRFAAESVLAPLLRRR